MIKITIGILCISFSFLGLILVKNPMMIQSQNSEELNLNFRSNGFYGTYKLLDKEYSFETSHPSDEFFLTRILQPDGSILAECLRNNNIVTVRLPQVSISFDILKRSPTQRSEETKTKILDFMISDDAKVIRKLFSSLVREKERIMKSHLKGFTTIVMVVGDDPGSSKLGKDINDIFFEKAGSIGFLKTTSGERKFSEETKQENYHRVERSYGEFMRSFTLPSFVDASKVNAEFKDGLLRVTMAKREEAKPKQIEVQVK